MIGAALALPSGFLRKAVAHARARALGGVIRVGVNKQLCL
jgi:hypothetical protein